MASYAAQSNGGGSNAAKHRYSGGRFLDSDEQANLLNLDKIETVCEVAAAKKPRAASPPSGDRLVGGQAKERLER